MTTIIGTGEVGALHSREELEEMQRLPLQRKIQITTARIIEWYQHYDGKVYVAFSGGKDSTVLLDIVRRIYPDVPAVFSDTGLEFPEVREFVKSCENVTIVRPEMNFRKVIEVYGYPVVSKRVADTVEYGHILWLEHNYACRVENDAVAYGALSTEHSVMCSNYAVDGDEITHVRRLLKEIYPYQNFSMVSDSYDYWNLVNNILPAIKEDVMAHHGCLAIRGDSGNPVEIVTETVFKLWEIFGGTVNSKGYKVLDPHIKALYGDSITPQRCEAVYKILMEHGFAINNVSLGVGSFSMQCLETMDGGEKTYAPYTRDTFGIAVKATYAEDADGKPIMIFKNPKTDSGHFKKSQRGCCKVVYDYTYHNFFCQDGLTWEESQVGNWLQPVFKDGKLLRIYTLDEVRKNLHEGNF